MKKNLIMSAMVIMLAAVMGAIVAMRPFAASKVSAAGNVYVGEVKVGMGETEAEAKAELLAEGYTILTDSDGSLSDLNYKAGTSSSFRKGPNQKIVYLGYKTTTNPKEAITDLAVMNMNGGYSTENYKKLIEDHMESEIKPFVNRFIATLEEFRANYNKPADTLAHIRADYYRRMLNMMIDDDTGKPLGDLLLNKTKYEMTDSAYNSLSAAEKKNHADIITLLMQGNPKAVLLAEIFVVKAADSNNNSWFERFLETDLDDLKASVKAANPALTTEADVNAELDKRYNDVAMAILAKWDSFSELIARYDDNLNAVTNAKIRDQEELANKVNTDSKVTKKDVQAAINVIENEMKFMETNAQAAECLTVEFLDATEYEDGTLLEFFEKDRLEFAGTGIRELYPLAASLSAGQIAGLDFLSIQDLITIAADDKESYSDFKFEGMETASVYFDVDREIYNSGGVALTDAALREDKDRDNDDSDFMLSIPGFIYWGSILVSTGLAVLCLYKTGSNAAQYARQVALNESFKMNKLAPAQAKLKDLQDLDTYIDDIEELNQAEQDVANLQSEMTQMTNKAAGLATKSKVAMVFGVIFTVAAAILAAWSIYNTISEAYDFYNTTYKEIPRYIVDRVDITEMKNGKEVVINNTSAYYKVVECNRKEGDSDAEKENYAVMGKANDLNGDVGKQWLSLYRVKNEKGKPILANSLKVVKGSSTLPSGYETGIHRFGEKVAFNLTSKFFTYNDEPNGTYVYYKNDTKTVAVLLGKESATASIISPGSLALGAGIGALLGAGIAVAIMMFTRKKKGAVATA